MLKNAASNDIILNLFIWQCVALNCRCEVNLYIIVLVHTINDKPIGVDKMQILLYLTKMIIQGNIIMYVSKQAWYVKYV